VFVIFLSRESFPVFPLPAATITDPDICGQVRSKLIELLCTWNVPWVAWSEPPSVKLTSLDSGLTVNVWY
jgi:hypothetical protein